MKEHDGATVYNLSKNRKLFCERINVLMNCGTLPEVIRRWLLSNPIGLSWAVGGAVLWAQLLLGTILCWKLEKALGLLPLLRCITDGQSSLLLGAGKTTASQFNASSFNLFLNSSFLSHL